MGLGFGSLLVVIVVSGRLFCLDYSEDGGYLGSML